MKKLILIMFNSILIYSAEKSLNTDRTVWECMKENPITTVVAFGGVAAGFWLVRRGVNMHNEMEDLRRRLAEAQRRAREVNTEADNSERLFFEVQAVRRMESQQHEDLKRELRADGIILPDGIRARIAE